MNLILLFVCQTLTEFNSHKNYKFLIEFLLTPLALVNKYLTGRKILKLLTFLSRPQQRKFVQYNATPKFKYIFSRAKKSHITAVPNLLTAEAEALRPMYKFRTELNKAVSGEL
jgi:hypothetical protein